MSSQLDYVFLLNKHQHPNIGTFTFGSYDQNRGGYPRPLLLVIGKFRTMDCTGIPILDTPDLPLPHLPSMKLRIFQWLAELGKP